MAEQLAACARQLFEGVSGSDEQRAANSWLMQFQVSDQAWGAALQLLEQPPKDAATQQNLTAPELVAMQILRLKTQQEWRQISLQQRQIVRQTLLKLLEATCISDGGLSARLVNAGVAAQRQQKSAAVLAEILGAIPLQILASERLWTKEEMLDMLNVFQAESEEVMKAVQMILSNMPEEQSNALRCLEGWIIGCVPAHETFGLNAAHLFSRGLMDVLFNIAVSDSEEQSQLLLACSAHKDIDVVQPTLEIWFFFLEESSSQNEISLELFGDASQEQIVTVLSRLVNSLVDHCKYPQSFVDTQQVSSDDPEIEAIVTLRREIADTLLSLFSKWPGGPGKPKGDYVSCVMGMSQMLSDSKDVAMIDALFFLLSYLVELFDVVSSDSESEEDQIPLDVPASVISGITR
ncbi:hypothetical protein BBO99_00005964 [Phytophthora kernoviae]|uniref:Importin N-terminal domain-containing protein n=2 Tax=Phytophthora kernoviae TaxID=325452 RepID=A0A3R7JSR1_9STRA|nr:hypothetical protein G195_006694 [Phytophthora kernoviae 00238/432]KAG2522541.1 hypothetical protein JM16_005779 [Phytophthora kernoviae]KAG2524256.1 hypothetical protein JM18_004828 [Phytophthora kernoviae]RLN10367.1 hypothetical protein BBI17_006040 [Phytophthora kernoviae]RLN78441.1 hypothetical protein BBO99_00005964 [Phytophthora kernoviae]